MPVFRLHSAPGSARQCDQPKRIPKHAMRCPDQKPGRLQPLNQDAHERPESHARGSLTRLSLRAARTFCRPQVTQNPNWARSGNPGYKPRMILRATAPASDPTRSVATTALIWRPAPAHLGVLPPLASASRKRFAPPVSGRSPDLSPIPPSSVPCDGRVANGAV
jgi:hypothetical protein